MSLPIDRVQVSQPVAVKASEPQGRITALSTGLSNDTFAAAGSLNGTMSGVQAVASSIDGLAGTRLAAESSDLNTGINGIGAATSSLLFAAQNIFKGRAFAKEGAKENSGSRLGIGAARIVRGSIDSLRNLANISKSGIVLSAGAAEFKDVVSKITLGATVGSTATTMIVAGTGIAMAKEVFDVAKEFTDAEDKDKFAELQKKASIQNEDIEKLQKDIQNPKKTGFAGLMQSIKESLMSVFGDKKTEFMMLFREVSRLPEGEARTALLAKLEKLQLEITAPVLPEEIDQQYLQAFKDNLKLNSSDGLENFKQLFCQLELERLHEGKIKAFDRVFGKDVRDGLSEAKTQEAKAELVAKAQKNVTTAKRIFGALGAIAVIGAIAGLTFGILDYVGITGVVFKLVETSVLLVTTLMVLGVDIFFLLKSMKAETDKTNKMAAIGTLIFSWLTQTSLLIVSKLAIMTTQVAVPLALATAGVAYLIRKAIQAPEEKKEEPAKESQDSGFASAEA